MRVSTLRPGYLVGLSTSIRGNVKYRTTTLESEHIEEDGTAKARWETERRVIDPEEQARAIVVRSKCRSLISARCAITDFGLLCPEDGLERLKEAIEEATQLARTFNDGAQTTWVSVRAITGHVAQDDAQAIRAINAEVRDLIGAMESGIRRLDAQAVRDAADKAREVGKMLSTEARERIQGAIDAARKAARQIVKAGESAAIEVDKATLAKLAAGRSAFLDLDATGTEIAAPEATARPIDLAALTTELERVKADVTGAVAGVDQLAQVIAPSFPAGWLQIDEEPVQQAAPSSPGPAQLDLI